MTALVLLLLMEAYLRDAVHAVETLAHPRSVGTHALPSRVLDLRVRGVDGYTGGNGCDCGWRVNEYILQALLVVLPHLRISRDDESRP